MAPTLEKSEPWWQPGQAEGGDRDFWDRPYKKSFFVWAEELSEVLGLPTFPCPSWIDVGFYSLWMIPFTEGLSQVKIISSRAAANPGFHPKKAPWELLAPPVFWMMKIPTQFYFSFCLAKPGFAQAKHKAQAQPSRFPSAPHPSPLVPLHDHTSIAKLSSFPIIFRFSKNHTVFYL